MYHFVEAHHGLKIKRMLLYFIMDECTQRYFLTGCRQLCFVDAHSILHHDYFVHYIKYYSPEEREEILAELENVKNQRLKKE